MGVQVGGLDVVTLLGAIAGLPLLGIGAGVGVYVGGPLLGAIAGLPLVGIGGGWVTSWRIGCGDVAGCHCWGAIAGDRRRGGRTCWHVVPLLGAIAGRRCWVPLLGIGGVGVHVGGLAWKQGTLSLT